MPKSANLYLDYLHLLNIRQQIFSSSANLLSYNFKAKIRSDLPTLATGISILAVVLVIIVSDTYYIILHNTIQALGHHIY